jgi:hypothetical protein
MALFDNLFKADIPGQTYLKSGSLYTASDDLNQLRRIMAPIFQKVGWGATIYLINFEFFDGIQEFQPPAFFFKSLGEGSSDYDESFNRITEEIYSENYSSPVGRIYNSKVKLKQDGGYDSDGNTNTYTGMMTLLRDDYIKLMRSLELNGGLENGNLLIVEVIGSLSSNPMYNTVSIYDGVRPGMVKEGKRTQGQHYYTTTIELYFTNPPKIYSLSGLLGSALARIF